MAVSIEEFGKALTSLELLLKVLDDHAAGDENIRLGLRDGCIQRFEYSIELAWKTSARVLGSTSAAANTVLREMARDNLIDDFDAWYDFIQARNITSHSYDNEVATKVLAIIRTFLPFARDLLQKLRAR